MVLNFDTEIDVLLFDQEKIVTYKELNNRFDITPYEAQELLAKYVEKKRKDEPKKKFYITYLIIGIDNQTKNKRINLVNEVDMDSIEKELKIISQKVYSVQSLKVEDFNIFFSNDIDSSNNIKRKSNLIVTFNEKAPINLIDQVPNVVPVKSEPDLAKLNLNKTAENKPKPIEPTKKSSNEPMDTNETVNKKSKLNEDTKPNAPAKPSATKQAKPAPKHQSTLTSFFKKA
ncbi:unnamed protein product [Brachionus calyciflorus]|uniref:DNA polymerase delta subunit 3 n=1 Tax=Brachionus calyciflorus TaxID=104777 RepID=A0A814CLR1_9BILA|nr:unnamed protein product [Brachionus calyciflorus]